jgi:hypothetical protein
VRFNSLFKIYAPIKLFEIPAMSNHPWYGVKEEPSISDRICEDSDLEGTDDTSKVGSIIYNITVSFIGPIP